MLDQTPCAQVFTALDGTLLFANSAFCRLSRLDQARPLKEYSLQDFLTRGAAIFYETQIVPTLHMRGFLNEISLDFALKDGTRIPTLANAILSTDGDGLPIGILIALLEATQRKHYETELLKTRSELEQIAEVVRRSSDGIFSLKPDGSILSWNYGAEQIFGYSSFEAVGQPLLLLFEEREQPEIQRAIEGLRDGAETDRDTVGLRKSGTTLEVAVRLTPHFEAPGTMVAFSVIIRDITVRKRTERALLQNEKLASVGRLASSIAHEINNPLEAVTNLLYILEARTTDVESKAFVRAAQEELARVSYVAMHTLKFHKQSSSRTALDLAALGESVLGLYRARLQNSGVTVIHESCDASPLCCFESELRQILANIVSNSFDAMRNGGRLILRCRNATQPSSGLKGVRITLADTGIGMDALTHSHIFEPFFSTKGIGGTGLGLWITKGLVEKNDGTIKIRSHASSQTGGTVVSMFFPHRTDC